MENIFLYPPLDSFPASTTLGGKLFFNHDSQAEQDFFLNFPPRRVHKESETFPCTFSRCFVCRQVAGQQTLDSLECNAGSLFKYRKTNNYVAHN